MLNLTFLLTLKSFYNQSNLKAMNILRKFFGMLNFKRNSNDHDSDLLFKDNDDLGYC